jgi:hypothetical protein
MSLDEGDHSLPFEERAERHSEYEFALAGFENKVVVSELPLEQDSLPAEAVCHKNAQAVDLVYSMRGIQILCVLAPN